MCFLDSPRCLLSGYIGLCLFFIPLLLAELEFLWEARFFVHFPGSCTKKTRKREKRENSSKSRISQKCHTTLSPDFTKGLIRLLRIQLALPSLVCQVCRLVTVHNWLDSQLRTRSPGARTGNSHFLPWPDPPPDPSPQPRAACDQRRDAPHAPRAARAERAEQNAQIAPRAARCAPRAARGASRAKRVKTCRNAQKHAKRADSVGPWRWPL